MREGLLVTKLLTLKSLLLGAIDDINEFGFQRSTTDKEAVDVALGIELIAILGIGRTTINDSSFFSNIL